MKSGRVGVLLAIVLMCACDGAVISPASGSPDDEGRDSVGEGSTPEGGAGNNVPDWLDGSVPQPPQNGGQACGNGVQDDDEGCDDGNTEGGDGCGPGCTIEEGFNCPQAGACVPRCGDGVLVGGEACDDGNSDAGDGCS